MANATDADGSVSKVEFFLEGTSLGIAARSHGSPTYKINWTLQANGPSLLTVIATEMQAHQPVLWWALPLVRR